MAWTTYVSILLLIVGLFSLYRAFTKYRRASRAHGLVAAPLLVAVHVLWAVGAICLGLTILRYAHGRPFYASIDVPGSAPLLDHLIWILFFVCTLLGIGVYIAWLWLVGRSPRTLRPNRQSAANE